jgi:hypothetical protein
MVSTSQPLDHETDDEIGWSSKPQVNRTAILVPYNFDNFFRFCKDTQKGCFQYASKSQKP